MWWQWPIVTLCVGWAGWTLARRAARVLVDNARSATGDVAAGGCGGCGSCVNSAPRTGEASTLIALAVPLESDGGHRRPGPA
jgi:hypothetical protein